MGNDLESRVTKLEIKDAEIDGSIKSVEKNQHEHSALINNHKKQHDKLRDEHDRLRESIEKAAIKVRVTLITALMFFALGISVAKFGLLNTVLGITNLS